MVALRSLFKAADECLKLAEFRQPCRPNLSSNLSVQFEIASTLRPNIFLEPR